MTMVNLPAPSPGAMGAWSAPLTLSADTIFQVRQGAVLIGYGGAEPAADDGLLLSTNDTKYGGRDSVVIPAQTVVRWKNWTGGPRRLFYGVTGA